ncbi:hypothetical protein LINGRAHAP2_LOCUS32244 [Linum grandiflorum]
MSSPSPSRFQFPLPVSAEVRPHESPIQTDESMEEAPVLVPTASPTAPQSATNPLTSYASALSRNTAASKPMHDFPMTVKDNDIMLSRKNGFKYLHTSGKLRAKLCAPLKKALVIRLLGKRVNINTCMIISRPCGNQ